MLVFLGGGGICSADMPPQQIFSALIEASTLWDSPLQVTPGCPLGYPSPDNVLLWAPFSLKEHFPKEPLLLLLDWLSTT